MNPEVEADLDQIQRDSFAYFSTHASADNGLVPDSTRKDSPASIATTGFGLAAYAVGVSRGYMTRGEAVERALATLRFFSNSTQSEEPDATGYRGFYYHFLDMHTGRRESECELSLIDSSLLLAGILAVAAFLDRDDSGEREIRALADALYQRADWPWALAERPTVAMGWKPECGFLNYDWDGYTEAMILYVLGLGSPRHPLPAHCYAARTTTYQWENLYGHELLYAGPLFIHQFSQMFIDFRGLQDPFMREMKSDYFENSRRATYVQQAYAIRNPGGFLGYGEHCFGTTAGEGPGYEKHRVTGVERQFLGYVARGVPHGPDDGTLSPWVVLASLPFAPEIVLPSLAHVRDTYPAVAAKGVFQRSFNPSFPAPQGGGWIAPELSGLELGPIVLMIENYRSGLLWKLMQRCPYIVTGLRRADFQGGWL